MAILRLSGLFDRPADEGCLQALREPPVIPGLTEPLVGLDDEDWNIAVKRLADLYLTRARLLRDPAALATARELIATHGYHRRDEELADAEAML